MIALTNRSLLLIFLPRPPPVGGGERSFPYVMLWLRLCMIGAFSPLGVLLRSRLENARRMSRFDRESEILMTGGLSVTAVDSGRGCSDFSGSIV